MKFVTVFRMYASGGWGGGERRCLGPRNDVVTTCKAVTLQLYWFSDYILHL